MRTKLVAVGVAVLFVCGAVAPSAGAAIVRWPIRITHFSVGTYNGAGWQVDIHGDIKSTKGKCRRDRDIDLSTMDGTYLGQFFSDSTGHFQIDRSADPQTTWVLKISKGGDGKRGCGGAKRKFPVSH